MKQSIEDVKNGIIALISAKFGDILSTLLKLQTIEQSGLVCSAPPNRLAGFWGKERGKKEERKLRKEVASGSSAPKDKFLATLMVSRRTTV